MKFMKLKDVLDRYQLDRATFWRKRNEGDFPPPVSLGGTLRWNIAELDAWDAAGCPPVPANIEAPQRKLVRERLAEHLEFQRQMKQRDEDRKRAARVQAMTDQIQPHLRALFTRLEKMGLFGQYFNGRVERIAAARAAGKPGPDFEFWKRELSILLELVDIPALDESAEFDDIAQLLAMN